MSKASYGEYERFVEDQNESPEESHQSLNKRKTRQST